jgi:hypothetical protein
VTAPSEGFSDQDYLSAIGRELRTQSEHLQSIRRSVGILAFLAVASIVLSFGMVFVTALAG